MVLRIHSEGLKANILKIFMLIPTDYAATRKCHLLPSLVTLSY